jgi:hypothetical protein
VICQFAYTLHQSAGSNTCELTAVLYAALGVIGILGRIFASISFTHCTAFDTGARLTISSAILQARTRFKEVRSVTGNQKHSLCRVLTYHQAWRSHVQRCVQLWRHE